MKQLQLSRDSTIANDAFVGPPGLVTVDWDRWEFRLHDGETPGGHRILNLAQLLELFMSKDSEFGAVVFAESDRGVLTRIGDRQYALRLLKGYDGIHVTEASTGNVDNPNGEAADFWIGIDQAALATLLLGLASGKLLYAGLSTGTADALAITVPLGWKNDQGSIVAYKNHIDVHDAATMQVTVGATPGSVLPIFTTSGSNKISQLLKLNTVSFLMRINDTDTSGPDPVNAYRLVNMVTAKELGIAPISGMTSTNVQDALAELKAGLGGGGGGGGGNDSSFWTFANFDQGASAIPLIDGQRRLVKAVSAGAVVHSGGSSGGDTSRPGGPIILNGITLAPQQGGGSVTGAVYSGATKVVIGILHREGTQIWFCPFPDVNRHTAASKYRVSSKIDVGVVASGATSVSATSSGGQPAAWTFSDLGIVAT